jgi:hypothetical protein
MGENVSKARRTKSSIVTVHRGKWTPPSLRDPKRLIAGGAETINGITYYRLQRWSPRRRAFVLEALVLSGSKTLRAIVKGIMR